MTTCPSTHARLLLTDVIQTLLDTAGSIDHGAGVIPSSAIAKVNDSGPLIRRASRVSQEAATEVAQAMFLRRANSPHPSGTLPVANFPTPEEIVAGQAAVKAAIGEKGSEQRAHASQLAALGMIAKEEALGFWLCDRFGGAFPSSKTAHLIGKRAAERLPGAKEKGKWKEAARRARKAAEQQGEEGDAIAAAGKQAAADARDRFEQTEFSVDMERPAEPPAPTPPTAPPPAPPTAPPTAPDLAPTPKPIDFLDAGDVTVAFFANSRHPEIQGYRGRPGASNDERFWDPAKPPCVPSDERPQHLFVSREAAEAAGAANTLQWQVAILAFEEPEDQSDRDIEEEALARVKYTHALLRLQKAFPELELGATGPVERTRLCPCGNGRLARWPWMLEVRWGLGGDFLRYLCPGALPRWGPGEFLRYFD